MSYKLIDERNEDFVATQENLYNSEEIVQNIRETGQFIHIGFMFPLLLGAGVLLFSAGSLLKIVIWGSDPIQWKMFGLFLVLLLLSGAILFGYSAYQGFLWRSGQDDKQLIKKIISHGKLTSGVITEVSDGVISYNYQFGDETIQRHFSTNKWENFNQGDEVKVLFRTRLVACLL